MNNLTKLALGLVAVASVQAASAATLVQYTFTGTDNATRQTPTVSGSNFTAGNFVFGAGLSGGSGFSGPNGSPAPSAYSFANVTTEAVSATSTDYFAFTVTPETGYAFDLNSLSFSYTINTATGTVTTESGTWTLRSSVDGFAADIASFSKAAVFGQNNGWVSTGSVSLTSSAYQNLGPVEFRIFLTDNATSSTWSMRIDNVLLDGAVVTAIPEPASVALLAGGAILGVAASRRRRHGRA